MQHSFSRRQFLTAMGAAATVSVSRGAVATNAMLSEGSSPSSDKAADRIVDMHVHFDEKNPNFVDDLVKVTEPLNVTACVLTPYRSRMVVAEAAKRHPARIVPFGYVDMDVPDAVRQAEEFHALGYRGLGELEFVKKPYTDPSYMRVYELANQYSWVILFHTGIVLRQKFEEPEDVASYRMRAFHLEEIARRFPKITVLGAHLGNPEYEWAGEVARWNPNVYFDLSGTTLPKMAGRLSDFQKIFWWSDVEWEAQPSNDPSPYSKLVFGTDAGTPNIETELYRYLAMFEACGVPEGTRKMILGGTLAKMLGLSD